MARGALAVLLVLVAPGLAGCLDIFAPPPPPPPRPHPSVLPQPYLVPDLEFRLDTPWGFVRANGSAMALPVIVGEAEQGAVYVGAQVTWRADQIFQVVGKERLEGPLYVQAPKGLWAGLRERQGWRPATAEDVSRQGYADNASLAQALGKVVPANETTPTPTLWLLNGTVTARYNQTDFTIASEEGPFVFSRNASAMVAIESKTLVSWTAANHTLNLQNDALAEAVALDPEIVEIQASWSRRGVDVRLVTPTFRGGDLQVDDDKATHIASIQLPGTARITMLRYVNLSFDDNAALLQSPNMTLRMGPR